MIGYDAWHWMPTQEQIDEIATSIAQAHMGPRVTVKTHIAGLLPPPPKQEPCVDPAHRDLDTGGKKS